MKWGVPFQGFVANALATGAVTVFVIHSPPGFFLGIAVHFALRELCRVDPHFFGKWTLFLNTKARSTTGVIWGGSRLQPSHRHISRAAEMATSV
jgi:type IV secretory pathway VirB3-like protein